MALYFERIEGKPGPALVFLHHGLGSVAQWRDFPSRLCGLTGLAGFVYDRTGHGRSPGWQGGTHRYFIDEVRELDELLRAERLGDFILMGHSDGGTIALLYAARPDVRQPRAIVAIGAHTFVEDITRVGIRAAADDHRVLRSKLRRMHGDKTDTLFWEWAGTWLAPSFDEFDIRARLHLVRCPVLALQGSADEYGTSAQLDALAENCGGPVKTMLIPEAAHEPHHQAPAATMEAISAWLGNC